MAASEGLSPGHGSFGQVARLRTEGDTGVAGFASGILRRDMSGSATAEGLSLRHGPK
jgi:hypothetical protein